MTEPVRAVRASDADRERVARLLNDHAAAGRLAPEELDERLDAAFAARTSTELDRLVEDLPQAPPPAPADRTREVAVKRLAHRAGAAAITVLVCVVVWLATGANGGFWPIWVMLGTGVGVAGEAWRLLGPAAGLTDEELGTGRHRERERRRRLER